MKIVVYKQFVFNALDKVRRTAFFLKIDPAPFWDFGAAKGVTVMPKKSGAAEGGKIIEEKSLPPPVAEGGRIVRETRLGAAEGSTNVEKSLTPPKTVKTLKKFFSTSGFV